MVYSTESCKRVWISGVPMKYNVSDQKDVEKYGDYEAVEKSSLEYA